MSNCGSGAPCCTCDAGKAYWTGIDNLESKNYNTAIKNFDEALKKRPRCTGALFGKGCVLERTKKYEDALAAYDKVLEIDPNYEKVICNRGCTLMELGRYKNAIKSLDKALEMDKEDAIAWYGKACIYAITGKNKKAIEALKEAIELKDEIRNDAKKDKDLKNIMGTPEFRKLVRKKSTFLFRIKLP